MISPFELNSPLNHTILAKVYFLLFFSSTFLSEKNKYKQSTLYFFHIKIISNKQFTIYIYNYSFLPLIYYFTMFRLGFPIALHFKHNIKHYYYGPLQHNVENTYFDICSHTQELESIIKCMSLILEPFFMKDNGILNL